VIPQVAYAILDGYYNQFRPLLNSAWQLQGCRYIDLDSVNGPTGVFTDTPAAYTLPASGSGSGDPLPASNAILLQKQTTGGRLQRPGRCYLAGLYELINAGNTISSGTMTTLQTACATFLTNVNASGGSVDVEVSVVHRPRSGTPNATPVTAIVASQTPATIRRRLRP
jgi:hypothetical protein